MYQHLETCRVSSPLLLMLLPAAGADAAAVAPPAATVAVDAADNVW